MGHSAGTVFSRPRVSSPRVLVVDDVPEIRCLHACFLHGTGMEVSTAANGRMALDAARRTPPDVIVTDMAMPVMDGLDLCKRLRRDHATRDVVVVVLTGDPDDHRPAALAAGCDAVLAKPCSRDLLLATIRQLLDRRT
jgi:CheY-like chemotaxis protein